MDGTDANIRYVTRHHRWLLLGGQQNQFWSRQKELERFYQPSDSTKREMLHEWFGGTVPTRASFNFRSNFYCNNRNDRELKQRILRCNGKKFLCSPKSEKALVYLGPLLFSGIRNHTPCVKTNMDRLWSTVRAVTQLHLIQRKFFDREKIEA